MARPRRFLRWAALAALVPALIFWLRIPGQPPVDLAATRRRLPGPAPTCNSATTPRRATRSGSPCSGMPPTSRTPGPSRSRPTPGGAVGGDGDSDLPADRRPRDRAAPRLPCDLDRADPRRIVRLPRAPGRVRGLRPPRAGPAKPAGREQRFAVFGDCAQGTAEQRAVAYRAYRAGPDYVVIPGDIVYFQGRIDEYRQRYFPVYNADRAGPGRRRPADPLDPVPGGAGQSRHDQQRPGPGQGGAWRTSITGTSP